MFEPEKVKNDCVDWIRQWFNNNGENCNAIIGISGGKDSSVVAALCVEALGAERVIGVLMPNGEQSDITDSQKLIEHLNIKSYTINISDAMLAIKSNFPKDLEMSNQTIVNLPPRIRMTTLYAISQSLNGRVANTCNLSEDWVGYSTRYGDSVGDFSPLSDLTVTEVKAIGRELKLPAELIDKVPSDGLCGKTDEENLGFSYETLDKYIREGICENNEIRQKIDKLHKNNLFKLQLMPKFSYCPIGE